MTQPERYLEGTHAVVTGASRGIGAAVAQALAARGAAVTLMARDAAALARQQATIAAAAGAATRLQSIVCDVTDDASVEGAFRRAAEVFGPVGILVSNAGAAESALFGATTRELWDRMLAVNLTASYSCVSQVLPAMIAARSGRIVTIASTAGLRGYKTMTAYCAAKHGLIGFTRALALETAKHGVTVNAVCPGYTETALAERAVANIMASLDRTEVEARAMMVRIIPRGTLTSPAEVADAVVWLCAPGSGAITGIALPVAGGEIG